MVVIIIFIWNELTNTVLFLQTYTHTHLHYNIFYMNLLWIFLNNCCKLTFTQYLAKYFSSNFYCWIFIVDFFFFLRYYDWFNSIEELDQSNFSSIRLAVLNCLLFYSFSNLNCHFFSLFFANFILITVITCNHLISFFVNYI